jgi:hypothetical protein
LLPSRSPTGSFVGKALLTLPTARSGKWPEDLGAIAQVKTALLIRIARLLKEQHEVSSQATAEYLDVFIGAHVFRLHLHVVSAGVKEGDRQTFIIPRVFAFVLTYQDFEFKLLEQQYNRLSAAVAALQQAGPYRHWFSSRLSPMRVYTRLAFC